MAMYAGSVLHLGTKKSESTSYGHCMLDSTLVSSPSYGKRMELRIWQFLILDSQSPFF